MSIMKRFYELSILMMLFVVAIFSIKFAEAITIETYSDRAAWELNISKTFQENFDLFTDYCLIPTFPNHMELEGSIKLQELSDNIWSENMIGLSDEYSIDIDDSSYLKGRVRRESIEGTEHNIRLNMIFAEPIVAFGADFKSVSSDSGIDFLLMENDNFVDEELISGESLNNDGFFGFIIKETPKNFTRVVLQARGEMMGATALLSEGFGMDNVTFVKAEDTPSRYRNPTPTNSVPEPGTIFLLGSLLIGLGAFIKILKMISI